MGSARNHSFSDNLEPQGIVEIIVTRGRPNIIGIDPVPSKCGMPIFRDHRIDFSACEVVSHQSIKNIIVNTGKDYAIASLISGGTTTTYALARLAIGDRGALPSDSQVPKVPVPTATTLYNEIARADAEAIVLNVGSPTVHEVKLVKTFSAVDIPITSFSNQGKPVVNEVGIIMMDPSQPPPLPRPVVFAPSAAPSDERLFALRTFKSVPFEISNDISVTFRYTIYIE